MATARSGGITSAAGFFGAPHHQRAYGSSGCNAPPVRVHLTQIGMPLAVGDRLGPYRILAPVGAGGMGQVYRALDTQLKREVALKTLLPTFANDPERYARFQREAEVLAALNHPNIATLYGITSGALAMEFIEGETLPCPLPLGQALSYARQIAEALEYAHERGVVHRDLKPSNIKVTPDGIVKLLDFGLAKALDTPSSNPRTDDDSPTITLGHTAAGQILGTAAYMSPEQAEGRAADRRADIWSFGAVLFEMLSGNRAFSGSTTAETLASVLKSEPDWRALPEGTPTHVRDLIRRCLIKNRKQRLQAIGEARIALENEAPVAPEPMTRQPQRLWVPLAIVIAALVTLSYVHFREAPAPRVMQRLTLATPEDTTHIHSFALSPDGTYLAMALESKGRRQLLLRPLNELEAKPIPGTDDATYPFWSPDSREIAFFAHGKMKKIAATGGPPVTLCDAAEPRGGSWSRDGTIIFNPVAGGPLQRVSSAGGVPVDITPKGLYKHPVFLPDGSHFLYLLTQVPSDKAGIHWTSLDGKEDRRILADQSSFAVASGRILFLRDDTLMAQRFNASTGVLTGEADPLVRGVQLTTHVNYAPVTASDTGLLVYQGAGTRAVSQMAWHDRSGKLLSSIGEPGGLLHPTLSPDQRSFAFSRRAEGQDLWIRDLIRGTEQRFTTDASTNTSPVWSPRGDRIAFASDRRNGIFDLYVRAVTATGQDELLLATQNRKLLTQWGPDGSYLLYTETAPVTKNDLWILPLRPDPDGKPGQPVPFLRTEFNELEASVSPDGHWAAYTSDKSGQREIYVAAFPSGQGEVKISLAGGDQPRWRGNGRELFFIASDGTLTAVPVKITQLPKPSFEPGAPQSLFDAHLTTTDFGTNCQYDVSTDGTRFLLNSSQDRAAPPLTVVSNWETAFEK